MALYPGKSGAAFKGFIGNSTGCNLATIATEDKADVGADASEVEAFMYGLQCRHQKFGRISPWSGTQYSLEFKLMNN